MKINLQFDQSIFNGTEAPFKWTNFYCPYYNEIKLLTKNNDLLYLHFTTDQINDSRKKISIIYLNTLNAQLFRETQKVLLKLEGSNVFFITNHALFSENEYSKKIALLLAKKGIAKFDTSKLFKMSDTSIFEIIDFGPSPENCLCPVFNTFLSHGARVANSKIKKSDIVRHEFRLSLSHKVSLIENVKI